MGFNFRKSFKIAPGVRLNVGKKGISSVSVGGKGARVSIGKKGTRSTVGLPGTGLSYSTFKSHKRGNAQNLNNSTNQFVQQYQNTLEVPQRNISFLLGIGILIMPYIFAWFTLRKGHSNLSRWVSFIWMIIVLIAFT